MEGAIRSGERCVRQVLNLKEEREGKNWVLIFSALIVILSYIFLFI